MEGLSAADLQSKWQNLEGAPDPFPAADSSPAKPATFARAESLDTHSEVAFPSLSPSSPAPAAPSRPAWGSASGPRIKPSVLKAPVYTDSLDMAVVDLSAAGRDGKPTSLGEIMKNIKTRYSVKVEASTNQRTRQTTFHLKADSQRDLDKAKRELVATLSPIITLIVNAPASTIATIIGPKGVTLKNIRDKATNVKIDIPRKEDIPVANGHANGTAADIASPPPFDDEEEEVTVPITVNGPQPFAVEAEVMLKEIIASKRSKATQRVRDIPAHILPFVKAQRSSFLAAAEGAEVNLLLNSQERIITVTGDRPAVVTVVETIKATVQNLESGIKSLKMTLPKKQHRLLAGQAVNDIMAKSKCSVEVASSDDPSEEVVVWGLSADLPAGVGAVMEKADSQYIHQFPLPGPITLSRQLLTYMHHINYAKILSSANPGITVFTPSSSAIESATALILDIAGEKPVVDGAVRHVSELIGKLIGAVREVNIDWLVHRIIMGKNAKKLKQFHEVHNVQVIFPPESAEKSAVLLVYDPFSPSASPSPVEKEKHLDDVAKELLKLAKDAADVKSQTVSVEKKWHEAILGRNNTTLNAIIGEDKTLSIKVGAEAGDTTEDVIFLRGASADVDRAVKEINKIVENAKNDEIVNSYETEFDISREFVAKIIGAQGAGVNKLREQLGVRIDVSDEVDEKDVPGKKRKAAQQKSYIKITGRKENVEEAKRRILTQVERLADETSEVLKIASQYHSSLIGQGGKYAIRLEEKYGVKITFPRHGGENGEAKTREQLKVDEVLIKGGKRGVADAKSELLEAVEFEKESNNLLKFTIPNRSVARILGKGGATINDIKANTGAQIDVDRAPESEGLVTNITVRGTKKAIAAAKAAILEISDQVEEEVTASLNVDNRFHRTIIGAGGQGLKDLVLKCGGPADPKQQANLIRFPRQGEPSDEVRLRGNPQLVTKLKAELEKIVETLKGRVVLALEIPAAQHRAFIGRGGQHLNDLQARTGVQVQFPGSRSYHQVGEAENAAEFASVDAVNIVKVSGSRSACEKAIEELKAQVKPATPDAVTATISVPLKYHHAISQQGNFFRTLRSFGVQVDQSAYPQKSAVPHHPPPNAEATNARIDDVEDSAVSEVGWQVVSNYQDAEEGNSEWTLKARDEAGLERAQSLLNDAITHAEAMSHVGFLTLADRSMFPRIVGSKGANVMRLRAETGADITVSKENNTIVIIGNESAISAAKDAILKMGHTRPGRRNQ